MFSCKGESYLKRLGGKARLKKVSSAEVGRSFAPHSLASASLLSSSLSPPVSLQHTTQLDSVVIAPLSSSDGSQGLGEPNLSVLCSSLSSFPSPSPPVCCTAAARQHTTQLNPGSVAIALDYPGLHNCTSAAPLSATMADGSLGLGDPVSVSEGFNTLSSVQTTETREARDTTLYSQVSASDPVASLHYSVPTYASTSVSYTGAGQGIRPSWQGPGGMRGPAPPGFGYTSTPGEAYGQSGHSSFWGQGPGAPWFNTMMAPPMPPWHHPSMGFPSASGQGFPWWPGFMPRASGESEYRSPTPSACGESAPVPGTFPGVSEAGPSGVAQRSGTPRSFASSGGDAENSDSDSGEEEPEVPLYSFAEAVARLAKHAPKAVSDRPEAEAPCPALAELALGQLPQATSTTSILKESGMVADAMKRAQTAVRGPEAQDLQPGSVPDFPGALACGKFLKPERLPFPKKSLLANVSIPEAALPLAQEDLLLLQERVRTQHRHASLSERCLTEWEETARRGLEATSIMDSFMGGLVSALKAPDTGDVFVLRQSVDTPALVAFIQSMADALKYSAGAFARLHLNAVLARRDAILSASHVARSASAKSSLRAVPLRSGSLFGNHVQATIRSQAEIRRDLALHSGPPRMAAKRSAPAGPSPQGQSRPKYQALGRKAFQRRQQNRGRSGQRSGPRAAGQKPVPAQPAHPQ